MVKKDLRVKNFQGLISIFKTKHIKSIFSDISKIGYPSVPCSAPRSAAGDHHAKRYFVPHRPPTLPGPLAPPLQLKILKNLEK